LEFFLDTRFREMYQKQANDNVLLVQCAMGVSRSATMVIMFFMKKFNVPYSQALRFVKARREAVDPNPGFIKQMEELESTGYSFEKMEAKRSLETKKSSDTALFEKINMI